MYNRTVTRLNYVLISGTTIKLCFNFKIQIPETFITQLRKAWLVGFEVHIDPLTLDSKKTSFSIKETDALDEFETNLN